MRRIYESEALRRDDSDPFSPSERDDRRWTKGLSGEYRSLNWDAMSHALVPVTLRDWAISVTVETPRDRYERGEPIPFRVTMRNRLPMPISLTTETPVLWEWSVDGVADASAVDVGSPPDERGLFSFRRGEQKRFERQWSQSIRVSKREWEPVGPGEYVISAGVNVADAERRGLAGETTVQIER